MYRQNFYIAKLILYKPKMSNPHETELKRKISIIWAVFSGKCYY
jgi:hypothetical protein